jgi:hypothetical protein
MIRKNNSKERNKKIIEGDIETNRKLSQCHQMIKRQKQDEQTFLTGSLFST